MCWQIIVHSSLLISNIYIFIVSCNSPYFISDFSWVLFLGLLWWPMSFINLIAKSPPIFGKFSATVSLNKISAPFSSPSGTPITYKLVLLMVSSRSCSLSSFFFLLFSLLSSNWIISKFLSLISQIFFSAWFILLVMLSFDLFISLIVFSSSRILIWSFFMFPSLC